MQKSDVIFPVMIEPHFGLTSEATPALFDSTQKKYDYIEKTRIIKKVANKIILLATFDVLTRL